MKRENLIRLFLECLMAIFMLALMDIAILGTYMHERIGLLIALLVILHLIIDRKQLKVLLRRILHKATPYPMRMMYVVDVLLAIGLVLIIITGVGISVTIFAGVAFPNRHIVMGMHDSIATLTLLLLLVHLWQHKSWIKAISGSMIRAWKAGKDKGAMVAAGTSLVAVMVITALGVTYLGDVPAAGQDGLQRQNRYRGGAVIAIDEERTIGELRLDSTTLAQYDGKDGRPAYIAVDGLIYDVGGYFIQGEHHEGARAGMDLTGQVSKRKCINALTHCDIVGVMVE